MPLFAGLSSKVEICHPFGSGGIVGLLVIGLSFLGNLVGEVDDATARFMLLAETPIDWYVEE